MVTQISYAPVHQLKPIYKDDFQSSAKLGANNGENKCVTPYKFIRAILNFEALFSIPKLLFQNCFTLL